MFGHLIIIISALPPVIKHPSGALGCFSVGLIFFGIGVGFFKANISPMIGEQAEAQQPRAIIKVLKSGERVIVDPNVTFTVIYMRYYMFVNVGSLVGQISMGTFFARLIADFVTREGRLRRRVARVQGFPICFQFFSSLECPLLSSLLT